MNYSSIIKVAAVFVALISWNISCHESGSPQSIDNRVQTIFTATNANELNKLIETGNVVVDFHGEKWCPPCRMFAPIFAKVAAGTPGVIFVKVDLDVYRPTGIRGVPTTRYYQNGKLLLTKTGAMSEAEFRSLIASTFGM